MKKSLFDFGDEKLDEKDAQKCKEEIEKEIDEDTKTDAKNLYEKYKNYSKEELIDEFVSTSKEKIKQGNLSSEKIRDTLTKVAPYMNESQKKFFEDLLSKINE